MTLQNKTRSAILAATAVLLLIPFIAMQFTKEVNWSAFDFLLAGVLLSGTGLLCEWVLRKVKTKKYRLLICGGILLALALLWVELAVGIFGSPIAGN